MAAGDGGLDSDRETARPSSGRGGVGVGQGEAAWGAKNRAGRRGLAGAASGGAQLGLAQSELEEKREAKEKGYGRRGEQRSFEAR